MKARKPKNDTMAVPSGPAGMEEALRHLALAADELNEAAYYFECSGLDSQAARMDAALGEVDDAAGVLAFLLGGMHIVVNFSYLGPKRLAKRAKAA